MTPGDPVVGSTILRRPAIQSPNFVTTVSGWTINADGSAEFNNLTIRGTFMGTDFVINSSGEFFYSPSEGAGNLVASTASTAGTDGFGDNYLAGQATYGSGFAAALGAGFITLYSGSLAGGWTPQATIETSGGGGLILTAAAGITLADDTEAGSNLTVDGTLFVGGASGGSITATNFNMNPPMAIPANYPTSGKTLAQTQAAVDGLIGSLINRGMIT